MVNRLLTYLIKSLVLISLSLYLISCTQIHSTLVNAPVSNKLTSLDGSSIVDNIGYLNKHEIGDYNYVTDTSFDSRKNNFGGLQFNSPFSEKDKSILTIYRKGRNFLAESMIYQDKKAKYFLSFGYDKSTNLPRAGFKLEF